MLYKLHYKKIAAELEDTWALVAAVHDMQNPLSSLEN